MSVSLGKNERLRPVIVAGKTYVCGEAGFKAALASGITGVTGMVFPPDGYYVRMASGVRIHDKDGEPFVFVKREGTTGFIVSCGATSEGVRYMFGAMEGDLNQLGITRSAPGCDRLERELAERLLWETSPEAGHTVYELHQQVATAEAEYEKCLDRVYGVNRGWETRCWKHRDAALVAADKAFCEARRAWEAAYRFSETPEAVSAALAAAPVPTGAEVAPVCLVARWDTTETASFTTSGPREEMSAVLVRLGEELDARAPGTAMYDPIPLRDTNGNPVGQATFEVGIPPAPDGGKPLLLVLVGDFTRMAITVTDVYTRLQSCVESEVFLTSATEPSRLASLYWRDLSSLERRWYQGATPESTKATHERVREQLALQDRTNPHARFLPTYEGIERTAESLGLQARLQSFGDSARVGYFRGKEWTGIASEICLNGKVLTTVDGARAEGTGYTMEKEWQREQLVLALDRLRGALDVGQARDMRAEAAESCESGSP